MPWYSPPSAFHHVSWLWVAVAILEHSIESMGRAPCLSPSTASSTVAPGRGLPRDSVWIPSPQLPRMSSPGLWGGRTIALSAQAGLSGRPVASRTPLSLPPTPTPPLHQRAPFSPHQSLRWRRRLAPVPLPSWAPCLYSHLLLRPYCGQPAQNPPPAPIRWPPRPSSGAAGVVSTPFLGAPRLSGHAP
jgi:hypothetical protein